MDAVVSKASRQQFVGFWRRFRVTPAPGRVLAEVEDDFHCMAVSVEHDGVLASRVIAELRRAPWTTCPGAEAQLQRTFEGQVLDAFQRIGEKKQNCTHLYDLAMLAAAHAAEERALEYDIFVSDAIDGKRNAEICRNGVPVLTWVEAGFRLLGPPVVAGRGLLELNDWIASLDPEQAEAAKLLRWANMIANGRSIPLDQQSDARKMPANCYTFQPQRAAVAQRVGRIRDFSHGRAEPLDGG